MSISRKRKRANDEDSTAKWMFTSAEREQLLASERAARAEAERHNKMKDEFLAMLAHELRNPLAPISAAAMILSRPRLDEGTLLRTRVLSWGLPTVVVVLAALVPFFFTVFVTSSVASIPIAVARAPVAGTAAASTITDRPGPQLRDSRSPRSSRYAPRSIAPPSLA